VFDDAAWHFVHDIAQKRGLPVPWWRTQDRVAVFLERFRQARFRIFANVLL